MYKSALDILIKFQAKNKQVLKGVTGDLRRTGAAGQQSAQAITGAYKLASKALIGMGAAMSVGMVRSMALAGDKANAVEQAFARLNANSEALMATMRKKSGGLLDDTYLQTIANKLSAVTKDADKMGSVTATALKIAAATGKDYRQVLESLTQALVTGRSQSLQTLGIVVDAKAAQAEYAAEIGKTASQLTKSEQIQAGMNAALKEANRQFGDVNTAPLESGIARLDTRWANLKSTIEQTTSNVLSWVEDTISGIDRIQMRFEADVVEDLARSYSSVAKKLVESAQSEAELLEITTRLKNQWGTVNKAAQLYQGHLSSAGSLINAIRGSGDSGLIGTWRWASKNTDEWQEILRLLKEAETAGLGYGDAVGAVAKIMGTIEAAQRKMSEEFKNTAEITVKELDEEIKLRQKQLQSEQKYWKLLDEQQKLAVKAGEGLNDLEAKRLELIGVMLVRMKEAGEISESVFDAWEETNAQDALGTIAAQIERMRDALEAISSLTANDVIRSVLGLPAKTDKPKEKPKPKRTSSSQSKVAEINNLPGMQIDLDRMNLELKVVQGHFDRLEEIKAEHKIRLREIELEGYSEDELKIAKEQAKVDKEIAIAEYKNEQMELLREQERKAIEEANRSIERSIKQRAAAEAAARNAAWGNVNNSIGLANQLAHGLIKTKTILNVVDGMTEAALSAGAFARYDYWAGAQHALASTLHFVAAGQSAAGGRKTGGGRGGRNSAPQSTASDQFLSTSSTTASQDQKIVVELVGMPEEYVDRVTVQRVNRAGSRGAKVNAEVIRPASAGRSGW